MIMVPKTRNVLKLKITDAHKACGISPDICIINIVNIIITIISNGNTSVVEYTMKQ